MASIRRILSMPAGRTALCLAVAIALGAAVGLLGAEDPAPAPARPQASATPPAATGGEEHRRLSDEATLSRWAYVRSQTSAHARPDGRSPQVAMLNTRTPDRTPEVVLALAEQRSAGGGRWVQVRLPVRPNNTTGWVRRRALGRYHRVTTAMTIDRARMRATLYDRGEPVWRERIAVGTDANPTPRGRFYVRSRIVPTDTGGIYGVFAFGLSGFSPRLSDWPGGGMVGIHGTDQPGLIPGRVSKGCVRVRNGAIERLRHLMSLGTPIRIR